MDLKTREIDGRRSQKEDASRAPEPGDPAPAAGHSPLASSFCLISYSLKSIEVRREASQTGTSVPEPGAPAPATGHSPRILFMTAFTIDFSRFEVHFSCSVGVLRRDSISAHVWYGLRTILT